MFVTDKQSNLPHRGRIHNSLFSSQLMKWPNEPECARMLHYLRLEMLARDKHSSLLDPFKGYTKNEVLRISNRKCKCPPKPFSISGFGYKFDFSNFCFCVWSELGWEIDKIFYNNLTIILTAGGGLIKT
jgi:hypothetical protein